MANKFSSFFTGLFDRYGAVENSIKEDTAVQIKSDNGLIPGVPIVMNNQVMWIGNDSAAFIDKAYLINSTVYSIVRLIAKKCAIVPLCLYEIKDENKYRKHKALTSQPLTPTSLFELKYLQEKALEEVKGHKLETILKQPNPNQSIEEFVEAHITFKLVTGNGYMWGPRMENGLNKGNITEIYGLNSQVITIVGYPLTGRVVEYILNAYEPQKLKPEDVFHNKYPNPQFGYELYGLSPLQAAVRTVTRSNSAVTASVTQLQNMGPEKILFDKNGDMTEEQANNLKLKISNEWFVGPEGRKQVQIAGTDLGMISLGLSAVDLDIIEQEKWSLRDLCNIYGISSSLLNDPENKTYNNAKEAQMGFINNAVIPEVNALAAGLTKWLATSYSKAENKKYVIVPDYSVFTELQQDMKTLSEWLNTAWWITPNQKLVAMNYGEDKNDPLMNQRIIPMGLQLMSDLVSEGNPDLPDDANNGDF